MEVFDNPDDVKHIVFSQSHPFPNRVLKTHGFLRDFIDDNTRRIRSVVFRKIPAHHDRCLQGF